MRRELTIVVATYLALGATSAMVWYWWWSPGPSTTTYLRSDGAAYFAPGEVFSGTGSYTLIAFIGAGLASVVLTYLLDRDALATLLTSVVAGLAGGLLMGFIGHQLGPEQTRSIDTSAAYPDGFPTAYLELSAHPAVQFLAMPSGVVLGALVVLVLCKPRARSGGLSEQSSQAERG